MSLLAGDSAQPAWHDRDAILPGRLRLAVRPAPGAWVGQQAQVRSPATYLHSAQPLGCRDQSHHKGGGVRWA
jgi:hypothetical protein